MIVARQDKRGRTYYICDETKKRCKKADYLAQEQAILEPPAVQELTIVAPEPEPVPEPEPEAISEPPAVRKLTIEEPEPKIAEVSEVGAKQRDFTAKVVHVVYDCHVDGDEILNAVREQRFGLYKGFVKWHVNDGDHTHAVLWLREKPRLPMRNHEHYDYFKVGEVSAKLVDPAGKGNTSPKKKMKNLCEYLTDGHDNGTFKDTWNYKYDLQLENAKGWKVKAFVLMMRGKTWQEIFDLADDNGKYELLLKKKQIMTVMQAYELQEAQKSPAPPLRPVQKKIIDRIENQEPRTVLWVVDKKGNKGKTHLLKHLALYNGACVMGNAKKADIACHYKGEDIVGINLTRTVGERVNYEAIESLKDGLVFDGKYESNCYVRPFDQKAVKVVIMSNEEPDYSAFSEDRWEIMRI